MRQMADRKMRYTENEVDDRHENRVDGENGNKGFATWGEMDVAKTSFATCWEHVLRWSDFLEHKNWQEV